MKITGNASNQWKLFFVKSGEDPRDEGVVLHEEIVESTQEDLHPDAFLVGLARRKAIDRFGAHATYCKATRIFL